MKMYNILFQFERHILSFDDTNVQFLFTTKHTLYVTLDLRFGGHKLNERYDTKQTASVLMKLLCLFSSCQD